MIVNERILRVPDVAKTLRVDGPEVYRLIDTKQLAARKGRDGLVYVTEKALHDYERRRTARTP
jgi:hypothetical protein